MGIGDELRFDQADNMCFGCSPHNEHGLQLTFTQVGDGAVETRYEAPAHICGAPGVVHGGAQAVLLDEAIGFALHAYQQARDGLDPFTRAPVVTLEFDLRYRRPVSTGVEVLVRAEVLRAAGRDFLSLAEICDADGDVLTSATARWRRLDRSD